jgi:dolichyl-phosphate-mannose--protein O-mannosyl transferase
MKLRFDRLTWVLIGLLVVGIGLGIFYRANYLRFPNDLYPNDNVFDEIYFPRFAANYLKGKEFYDVHPPLGKLIIALGIQIGGNNPVGWRLAPLAFGIALIPLIFAVTRRMTGSTWAGVFAGFMIAVDGMFLVYSRSGLMDGILVFFILTSVYFALRCKEPWMVTYAAMFLGLAIAIKWTALATIVPMLWILVREGRWKPFLKLLPVTFGLYFSIVVLGQWMINAKNPVESALKWHVQAEQYHAGLTEGHSFGSHMITWPIMGRPVLFMYKERPDNTNVIISAFPNPGVLIGTTIGTAGLLVLAGMLWKRRKRLDPAAKPWPELFNHPVAPAMAGFLSAWLPYAPVKRVMFLYHYMPAYAFGIIMLAWLLSRVWENPIRRKFAVAALSVFVFLQAWIMPANVGYIRLAKGEMERRLVIPKWLW